MRFLPKTAFVYMFAYLIDSLFSRFAAGILLRVALQAQGENIVKVAKQQPIPMAHPVDAKEKQGLFTAENAKIAELHIFFSEIFAFFAVN
jgi:hypothetical protein